MIFPLDIVFQSGDFYNQDTSSWWLDLLNTIIGAFLGSCVTIFALYRTFRQDKQTDEDKKIEFQNEKLRYFQSLIKSISKDLKSQIDYFKTFSDEIKADPIDLPALNFAPLNDLTSVVHKINQEDYYHSYLAEFGREQDKIEEFREIYSFMYFFDGNITLIKERLQKAKAFDYQRQVELKDLIEKAREEATSYLINTQLKAEQPNFVKFLNDKILEFHQNRPEETDLTYYIENFVNKIKTEELVEYSRNIPEAYSLILKLKSSSQNYGLIKLHNIRLAVTFEKDHELFDTEFKKLQPKTQRLNNYNS